MQRDVGQQAATLKWAVTLTGRSRIGVGRITNLGMSLSRMVFTTLAKIGLPSSSRSSFTKRPLSASAKATELNGDVGCRNISPNGFKPTGKVRVRKTKRETSLDNCYCYTFATADRYKLVCAMLQCSWSMYITRLFIIILVCRNLLVKSLKTRGSASMTYRLNSVKPSTSPRILTASPRTRHSLAKYLCSGTRFSRLSE